MLALSITAALGGCQTISNAPTAAGEDAMASEPLDLTYIPANEPLRRALYHFERGEYGLSERYYRAAVEKTPDNAVAWVGLAASYDSLHRFDLADQAYQSAIRIAGKTTQILNNQGYSYLLRGDLKAAREKFRDALKTDPDNATIRNNIRILNAKLGDRHRQL